MKKDTIYKIYDLYKDNPQLITDNLKEFLILDNYSGNIMYEIASVNKDLIDDENIKIFLDLAYSIGRVETPDITTEILNKIKEMLSNDYISNDENLNEIIGSINYLLNYEYWQDFECQDSGDVDFYKSFNVSNIVDILESNTKVEMNEIYMHNTSFVLDNYTKVLHELHMTESDDNSLSENDIKIRRLTYYTDLMKNENVAKLCNKKYNIVSKLAGCICNIEKLKGFKNVVLFSRLRSNGDFAFELDDYVEELNNITIDRISKKLGLKREYDDELNKVLCTRKNYDEEFEVNTVKKILKPEKKY